MVVNMLKRSLSFPNKIPAKAGMSHHIRSISLPCRSHPLISQVRDEVAELRSAWSAAEPNRRTLSWLCDGLTRLRHLHDSLDDLLHLPQTQDSLRRHAPYVDKVLEHFLRFLDAFGIFQTSLMALREDHSAAQVAVRRRDDSNLALYVKARKTFAKEIQKLVPSIGPTTPPGAPAPALLVGDDEVVSVVDEVIEATKEVSRAVFSGIAGSYARKRRAFRRRRAEIEELRQVGAERLRGMRSKGEEEVRMVSTRMRDLENCIVGLECGSQRVFRGLITARVSLLNCLTHSNQY